MNIAKAIELIGAPLAFTLCVLWHAFEEKKERKGLARYFEINMGFHVGQWFDWLLFGLAITIPLAPFMLIAGGWVPEDVGKSFVAGALLTDALSTHLFTLLRWKRLSPGWKSAILYPFLAYFVYKSIVVFSPVGFTLGILAFLGLWPLLFMTKWLSEKFTIVK